MRDSVVDKSMAGSSTGTMTDAQIRSLCAEAAGIQKCITYITENHESIA